MATGRVTKAAVALLMVLEGLRLVPYKDIAGVWTDGYGNTENVVPGQPITKEKAEADLRRHLETFSEGVVKYTGPGISDGMLDAFTLLSYNIGLGAFSTSTALKEYKLGNYMDACLYTLRYDKARVNGKLVSVKGLAIRRYQEYNLCIAGVPNAQWSQVPRR